MSGSQSPETPLVIWGLGAGMVILSGIVTHLLRLIWRTDATTIRIASEVKADLIRSNEAHVDAMEALTQRFEARWNEANSVSLNARIENQANHKENIARHERMMERLTEIPTRAELAGMRGRRSTDVNA